MPGFIDELRRRNVFRAAVAYLAMSWLLIEVATTILPLYPEAPEWLARTLVTLLLAGFVPALIFSWLFELTAAGIQREKKSGSSLRARAGGDRILDFVAGGAVVGAIALFLWAPKAADRVPSVAVLPFVNMSSELENEYFSDGLTETLIHMIAQSEAIKVTSRTSVFALKGKQIDVREVGDLLDVAHVLEGSVQRSKNTIRITAQLIDTRDGSHIWSKNYDRNVDDIFAIQDEIAKVVANAMRTSLLKKTDIATGVGTENLEAYDLYLQAVAARVPLTGDALAEAEALLKQALAIDAEFLAAKTDLASVYFEQWDFGFRSQEQAVPPALALTRQVLAAQPNDVRATATQLMIEAQVALLAGDMELLDRHSEQFRALVARAPSEVDARVYFARTLAVRNEPQEELEQLQQAAKIDPLRADIFWRMSNPQRALGDVDGAKQSIRRSLALNPDQVMPYLALAEISLDEGDTVGYIDNYLRAWRRDPDDIELVGVVATHLYMLKLVEEGDEFLEKARAINPDHPIVPYNELIRAAVVGDDEKILEVARVLIEDFDGGNRLSGFVLAVANMLRSGRRLGRADESLDYLQQQAPQLTDPGAGEVALHIRLARMLALHELAQLLPQETVNRIIDDLDAFFTRTAGSPQADMRYYIDRQLALGEGDEAVELYLQRLTSEPSSQLRNEEWRLDNPFRAELAADPRVQAELERLGREVEEIRQQVREFLADLPEDANPVP